eukprot:5096257-Alexandrium_andersonii.AAC.1
MPQPKQRLRRPASPVPAARSKAFPTGPRQPEGPPAGTGRPRTPSARPPAQPAPATPVRGGSDAVEE